MLGTYIGGGLGGQQIKVKQHIHGFDRVARQYLFAGVSDQLVIVVIKSFDNFVNIGLGDGLRDGFAAIAIGRCHCDLLLLAFSRLGFLSKRFFGIFVALGFVVSRLFEFSQDYFACLSFDKIPWIRLMR